MHPTRSNLTRGSVPLALLRFFWPVFLANMLQALYNIVDMAVVGRYVGSNAVAAVSNASTVVFIVSSIAIGLGTGGTVRIAHAVGAEDNARIRPIIDSMMALSATAALAATATLLVYVKPLFFWMRVPGSAMEQALGYMEIVTAGNVFVFANIAASCLMRGMGDSRQPMYIMAIAAVINTLLDIVMVGWCGMGVHGAAYATVIAQAFSCIAAMRRLYAPLLRHGPAVNVGEVRALLRIGLPSAMQLIGVNISYAILAAMLNKYGVDVAAASGIGLRINTMAAMPCWAFGFAVTAMIGQCLGSGDAERARATLRYGLLFNLAATGLLVLAVNSMAAPVVGFFAPGNADVIRIGVDYLRLCCSLNCLIYCAMYTLDAFATGAGDAAFAMVNGFLDAFAIKLLFAWLLGTVWGYGYAGVFLAQAVSPLLPALAGWIYYRRGGWKTRR